MTERKRKARGLKRLPRKQTRAGAGPRQRPARRKRPSLRAGMPALDSIISGETFQSPKGKVYRILKTSEVDEYDEAVQPSRKRKRGVKPAA